MQDYASGAVSIQVYESYVAEVVVTSSIPGIERRFAPYIDRITAMRPIRIAEAERAMLLLSEIGGVEVTATLVRPTVPVFLSLAVGF